jgi:D-alanine--poly(phosphoribitol) ligase subunit 1
MNSSYRTNLWDKFLHIEHDNPSKFAISNPEAEFSFSEIKTKADSLSKALLDNGIVKGDVVAIFQDKSVAGFCLMLACLRIGAPYVNLDPGSPQERLKKMLNTCEPALVVACSQIKSNPLIEYSHPHKFIAIDDLKDGQTLNPYPVVTGTDPAYLMFTSGSTGLPKAAVISHGALLNFIDWARDRFELTPDDRFTNVNPLYFDNSVFDFYASIFNGACLCPTPSKLLQEPLRLANWVKANQCTIWFSVPSLLVYLLTMHALSQDDFPNVRKIIFGGEGFPKKKLKQLFELLGKRMDLENVYGPTEATCICSAHTVTEDDFLDMSKLTAIGRLAPNFDSHIISEDENIRRGELVLIGPQVCLGYYNSPEQTKLAFIQNPKHSQYRDVGYKTGDIVELDDSGNFHFLGRKDLQVKLMGHRIELEEIESALFSSHDFDEVAVTYRSLGDGLGRIVAHLVCKADIQEKSIKESLKNRLPSYMIPKKFVVHDSLPKNANGKIDRKILQQQIT